MGELGSLTFRRAGPADAAAFAQLMADEAVFAGLLQMPYPSAEQWRVRLEQSAQDQDALPLAAIDGDGVLAASAGIFPMGRSPRRRHCGGLGVSVASAWQGRGLGREMLRRLLDWSDHWIGYLRLELTVYTDNVAAIALYRKFGFEIEGTHRGYALRRGGLADVHAMARLHPQPPRP